MQFIDREVTFEKEELIYLNHKKFSLFFVYDQIQPSRYFPLIGPNLN